MKKTVLFSFILCCWLAANSQSNLTQSFWVHFNSTPITAEMIQREAPRRQIVLLNAWDYKYISQFKKVNPAVKVFVYKDLSSTRDYHVKKGKDDELLPAGIGYVWAKENHPEWFLKDEKGKQLYYSGYGGHAQMDIGNEGYQDAWIKNVVTELVKNGWDGVFLDNALFGRDEYHPGVFPANYKSDEKFQGAYKTFLSKIDAALKSAKKISIANMSSARSFPGMWNEYLKYLDGGFDEWWLVFGKNNYVNEKVWQLQFEEMLDTDAVNKLILVQPHSSIDDEKGFYYAFATYWLGNNGNAFFSEQPVKDEYGDPQLWRKEYNWDLGKPLGKAYSTNNGRLYRRDFEKAIVLVNITDDKHTEIVLEQEYIDMQGIKKTKAAVSPKSGLILRKF